MPGKFPPSTESELTEIFKMTLHSAAGRHDSDGRILLHEFDGVRGRPDLVDVSIQVLPFAIESGVLATFLRSPAKASLLAVLRYGASRRREYLTRTTGLSDRSLYDHIGQLAEADLVRVGEDGSVSLGRPLPWSMVDIVAYEAKLSDWRRALRQAIGYRSFSHSVRVVMPVRAAEHARKLAQVFHSNGIGLIAIEENGHSHIKIRSRRQRPSSRRLYLMAVGVALTRYLEKTGKLHPGLGSETI